MTTHDLELIADLPGDMPWSEARKIMGERKAALSNPPVADPIEPMGLGHKCRHCGERIDLTYDRAADATHWVHDRTGENYCAGRAIAAVPTPEQVRMARTACPDYSA